ncbi:MAG: hypothetical protein MJ066_06285 [Clostridia bacterium]|nr:hypothetical protein [Clostridia bacterium]
MTPQTVIKNTLKNEGKTLTDVANNYGEELKKLSYDIYKKGGMSITLFLELMQTLNYDVIVTNGDKTYSLSNEDTKELVNDYSSVTLVDYIQAKETHATLKMQLAEDEEERIKAEAKREAYKQVKREVAERIIKTELLKSGETIIDTRRVEQAIALLTHLGLGEVKVKDVIQKLNAYYTDILTI